MSIVASNLQQHYFAAKDDPRYTSSCRHCGRVPEFHIPSPDIPREIEKEEAIRDEAVALAPHLARLDYRGLMAYSLERMHHGPIRNARKRNWSNEAEQEYADAVNYAVEDIKEIERLEEELGIDLSVARMAYLNVIIKTCEAWDGLQNAKRILAELR